MIYIVAIFLIAVLITTSRHKSAGKTNFIFKKNAASEVKSKNNFSKSFDTTTKGSVIEIESKSHYNSLLSNKKNIIVLDFYSHTCPPCKVLSPYLDKFAEQFQNEAFLFGKVDCINLGEVAMENAVKSMPTIIFFEKGHEAHRITGCDVIGIKKFLESRGK
ncbi:hypothetical protein QEN19_002796 [Hanseniaspora menglaensis]